MALADTGADGQVYALAAAIPITLAGTVAKGDLLGYSTGWKRAWGDASALIQPRLVALESGVSGNVIKACPVAQVDGRFGSACVPATQLYASNAAGEQGRYTETAPTGASGDSKVVVGFSLTTTGIIVALGNILDAVA